MRKGFEVKRLIRATLLIYRETERIIIENECTLPNNNIFQHN